MGGDIRLRRVDGELRGNASAFDRLRLVTLSFVEQEEEGLILDDRTANIDVKLVIANGGRAALAGPLAVIAIMVSEIVVRVAEAPVVDPRRPACQRLLAHLLLPKARRS